MFAWPERPELRGRVAIVDYRLGNLFSVAQACARAGLNAIATDAPAALASADALILPGMGAFGDAMDNLERLDLVAPLKDFAASGKPLIGVCLGLQILMSESEEFGRHDGLGLVPGRVRRLAPKRPTTKVPQIGWNHIRAPRAGAWEGTLLRHVRDDEYMYFVHSYAVEPADAATVLAESDYDGHRYCAALSRGPIQAFQFHPERSATAGLSVYRALAEIILGKTRDER
jgi:glutamine amidotransferase